MRIGFPEVETDMRGHRTNWSWLRSFPRCQRGAAAIEFGLILPVLTIFLLGVIDGGLGVFRKMEVTSAARAGAQHAILSGYDNSGITSAVQAATNLGSAVQVQTSESCECWNSTPQLVETLGSCGDSCADTSNAKWKFVTVNTSYDHTPMFLDTVLSFSETATVRIE